MSHIRDVLDLVAHGAGVSLQFIHADGGAVSNQFRMQFVADIAQTTVRASSLPELSALGAVLSGALGMKHSTSLDDLRNLALAFSDYQPEMNPELARAYYGGRQAAVQRVVHQPEQG